MAEEFTHRDGVIIENPEFTMLSEAKKTDGRGTTFSYRIVTGMSRSRMAAILVDHRSDEIEIFPYCFVLGLMNDIHHSMMTLEQARDFFTAQLARVNRLIAQQE
jgi:hypothetical protein